MTDCGGGVWTEVANINMSIPSTNCPKGYEQVCSPKSCRKSSSSAGCSSAYFSTYGQSYKKVCGKIIGYQDSTPDAFQPHSNNPSLTLDDGYVDGVSLTYNFPRQHSWTFAAQPDIYHRNTKHGCPCTYPHTIHRGKVPQFVGLDFFCETGCEDITGYAYGKVYTTQKLWDGSGHVSFHQSCNGRSPWFLKEFSYKIKSNTEVRSCLNQVQSNEDLLLEEIYLYIQ